jgi:glycosyltransferase involved in cell wall biosynthesis
VGGRVLRIVTRLNRGGPLRQLEALVPGLASLGWTGPVLVGEPEPHEEDGAPDLEAQGAAVVRVASLRRGLDVARDARAFRAVLAAIRAERPDVVHTHTAKAGALGRVAAGLARVPAVHTFHGHHLEAPWPAGALARVAERALGPPTTAAVALSPRQRRDLVDVHRVLPPAKVRVIGPGIDLEGFRRRADAAEAARLREAHAAPGRPLFLWAGRFVPVKDPFLLLDAVERSARAFRVAMLGDGPLRADVLRAASSRGLGRVLACPGPARDTAPWVAASDGVVLSSRSEGTPVSVLEAMALGKPVVAPTVGGICDLVAHEGTGLWVPPGDAAALAAALDRLAGDAALRARLGDAGAALAPERFGRERLARETAALYEEVSTGARG